MNEPNVRHITESLFVTLVGALLAASVAPWSPGQCPTEAFMPSTQMPGTNLPAPDVALSMDGQTAVVGVRSDDTAGPNVGAAFVMTRGPKGWTTVATLIPPDVAPNANVGSVVALSDAGDRALVAASLGTWIYALVDGTWALEGTLVVGEGSSPVGVALSRDGTIAAVRVKVSTSSWEVRIFQRVGSTWALRYTVPTMPPGEPDFGPGLALSGDGAILAIAQRSSNSPPTPAKARIYERIANEWVLTATFTDLHSDVHFAINSMGRRIFVADATAPQPDGSRGILHILERTPSGWFLATSISAPDPAPPIWSNNYFGSDLACSASGDRLVIGDGGDSGAGVVRGAFYFFDLEDGRWIATPKITLPGQRSGQALASDVAISGGGATALIAHWSPLWEIGASGVIEYALDGFDRDGDHVCDQVDNCAAIANQEQVDCDGNGVGDACDLAEGASDCDANGIPDVCDLTGVGTASYREDDGRLDAAVGASNLSLIWLNHFTVVPGAEVVSAIDVVWGVLPQGSVGRVCLWSDPNQDGVPNDGLALVVVPTVVLAPMSSEFERVPIPPTYIGPVGTSFFVGASYTNLPGSDDDGPVAADSTPPVASIGWGIVGTNVYDLSQNWAPQQAAYGSGGVLVPFVPMVRAIVSINPDCDGDGQLDACQISDDPSLDANGNGRLDECELLADLNADGVVSAADLGMLLAAWGSPGPGDLDGDGVVGAGDLAMLLAAWGT